MKIYVKNIGKEWSNLWLQPKLRHPFRIPVSLERGEVNVRFYLFRPFPPPAGKRGGVQGRLILFFQEGVFSHFGKIKAKNLGFQDEINQHGIHLVDRLQILVFWYRLRNNSCPSIETDRVIILIN